MDAQLQEMINESIKMFIFFAVEMTFLFLFISYFVGVLQEYIPPEKIRNILSSKKGKGYVIASLLATITPFCSCSTIPFLKGLLKARAGFGPMMVFLFSSPLLNPIVIGLFFVTFGVQVTVFYFAVAMGVAILSGYTLEKFGFEKYIRKEAYAYEEEKTCCNGGCKKPVNKWLKIWQGAWASYQQILPYLVVSMLIGSIIHGFVPTEFIADVAGEDNPLAIPVSAVIGVPLYIRAAAMIPLSITLAGKGMALGAIMALIIGSAGASLTEVILLKSIFKAKLIIAFLFVVLSMAIGGGYLYSFIF
jgi:hypothetical protein